MNINQIDRILFEKNPVAMATSQNHLYLITLPLLVFYFIICAMSFAKFLLRIIYVGKCEIFAQIMGVEHISRGRC